MEGQQLKQGDPVVNAIEQVLAAERAAEASLRDCREAADARASAGRERAAAIGRRADARISKLHTAYLGKIAAETAKLSGSPAANGSATTGSRIDEARLARAAQRLAAKLVR